VGVRVTRADTRTSIVQRLVRLNSRTVDSTRREAAQTLRARAREAISAYETPTGLEIPGVSLIAVGASPLVA